MAQNQDQRLAGASELRLVSQPPALRWSASLSVTYRKTRADQSSRCAIGRRGVSFLTVSLPRRAAQAAVLPFVFAKRSHSALFFAHRVLEFAIEILEPAQHALSENHQLFLCELHDPFQRIVDRLGQAVSLRASHDGPLPCNPRACPGGMVSIVAFAGAGSIS